MTIICKKTLCRACNKSLNTTTKDKRYGTYVLIHPRHKDRWHINCIPRLVKAEGRLEIMETKIKDIMKIITDV